MNRISVVFFPELTLNFPTDLKHVPEPLPSVFLVVHLDVLHVVEALQHIPLPGSLDSDVPADPTIYRIHEITQVYGTTIKALIHEEFGDGIMSTINFKMDIERVEDPEGERVRITYEGKFLPYK